MLRRWSGEVLDRELARRNPVLAGDVSDAAHGPAATALLRHIFELADGGGALGAEAEAVTGAREALHPVAYTEAPDGGAAVPERAGEDGPLPRSGVRGRTLVTALAVFALVAGGVSAVLLSVTGAPVPHRTTTAWLASRPLAADVHGRRAAPMLHLSSTWRLMGDLVPAGWKLGTPGPGPGTVTCPTTAICYVTGDTSPSASGPVRLAGLYVSTDGAASWSVLALPQGFTFTSALTCIGALTCAAGGTERGTAVFAQTQDGGHRWTVTTTGHAGGLVQVACVTVHRCMGLSLAPAAARALVAGTPSAPAVDESFARTIDGGNTWSVTPLPAAVRFTSLQCTSPTACVAVGYPATTGGPTPRGVALWTDDAGRRWAHGTLPSNVGFSQMSGLSCSAPARCMAVGTVAVPNPSRCATVLQHAPSATVTAPTSFSCTTGATTLVSTMLTTRDGGASWQRAPLPASVPQPHLDDVACAGPLTCWAGGTEAVPRGTSAGSSVLVGTTDGGASWTTATVAVPSSAPNDQGGDAYLAVGSISCPSPSVCIALGMVDQGAKFVPVYRMDAAP